MSDYSNGLSYVPYTSRRHSRNLSLTESSSSDVPNSVSNAIPSAPPIPSTSSSGPRILEKDVDALIQVPSRGTFRRLGSRQVSAPSAPSPLRPKQPLQPSPLLPLSNEPNGSLFKESRSLIEARANSPLPAMPPSGPIASPGRSPLANPDSLPDRMNSPIPQPLLPPPPPSPPPPPPTMVKKASPLPPAHKPLPPITSESVRTTLDQRTPYRQGFQPKGAYHDRTEEFIALRQLRTDPKRGEERRIERRLEKLIKLHFNIGENLSSSTSDSEARPQAQRRSSSFFDFPEYKGKNAGDILRSVIEPKAGTPTAIRAAEQVITPWQDDATASSCPLCQTAFQALTNRKHHCRLCGRVVCSLPPKKPSRIQQCSLLITVDTRTGRISQLAETIAYGVTRRTSFKGSGTPGTSTPGQDISAQPKAFRICRDCNGIVFRKENLLEAHTPTAFTRLYQLLIRVEGDIEAKLESLEALLPSVPSNPTNAAAVNLRKQLSGLFSDYDAVAKRIRALPCLPDSSQDRVQTAVWNRAVGFMQVNIGMLQRMPKSTIEKSHSRSPSSVTHLSRQEVEKEADTALAFTLQPLLEQEALLESFIHEANAQRKFEDVKSLKTSLAEIRVEIGRIVGSANPMISNKEQTR